MRYLNSIIVYIIITKSLFYNLFIFFQTHFYLLILYFIWININILIITYLMQSQFSFSYWYNTIVLLNIPNSYSFVVFIFVKSLYAYVFETSYLDNIKYLVNYKSLFVILWVFLTLTKPQTPCHSSSLHHQLFLYSCSLFFHNYDLVVSRFTIFILLAATFTLQYITPKSIHIKNV